MSDKEIKNKEQAEGDEPQGTSTASAGASATSSDAGQQGKEQKEQASGKAKADDKPDKTKSVKPAEGKAKQARKSEQKPKKGGKDKKNSGSASKHPDNYRLVVFQDVSNGYNFLTRSCAPSKENIKWEDGNEYPLIKMEISNTSHPFYTGKMKFVDTAGRVDKFRSRYKKYLDKKEGDK